MAVASFHPAVRATATPRRRRCRPPPVRAAAGRPLTPADVVIERPLAAISLQSTVGIEGVTSTRLPGGDGDEKLTVRLYKGRVVAAADTRVILKAYPPSAAALAANEAAAHRAVGGGDAAVHPPQVARLVGSFTAAAGERWLAFADSASRSAAAYARLAHAAGTAALVTGPAGQRTRAARPAAVRTARRSFVTKTLRDAATGLAALHDKGRLHCALSATSLLLAPCDETSPAALTARLADLAFSADVSDAALWGGSTIGALWDAGDGPPDGGTPVEADAASPSSLAGAHAALWARAAAAGARSPRDRAAFGRADDVAAWGLLAAFLAIAPLAAPASPPVTAASIAHLVETVHGGDVAAFRAYAEADAAWSDGCAFLDAGGGAGWDCLARAVGPWRARPDAAELLTHPFLSGEALEGGAVKK